MLVLLTWLFSLFKTRTLAHLVLFVTLFLDLELLTVEQLAGYLLQHVLRHDQRLDQLEKAMTRSKVSPSAAGDA